MNAAEDIEGEVDIGDTEDEVDIGDIGGEGKAVAADIAEADTGDAEDGTAAGDRMDTAAGAAAAAAEEEGVDLRMVAVLGAAGDDVAVAVSLLLGVEIWSGWFFRSLESSKLRVATVDNPNPRVEMIEGFYGFYREDIDMKDIRAM